VNSRAANVVRSTSYSSISRAPRATLPLLALSTEERRCAQNGRHGLLHGSCGCLLSLGVGARSVTGEGAESRALTLLRKTVTRGHMTA